MPGRNEHCVVPPLIEAAEGAIADAAGLHRLAAFSRADPELGEMQRVLRRCRPWAEAEQQDVNEGGGDQLS